MLDMPASICPVLALVTQNKRTQVVLGDGFLKPPDTPGNDR